MTENEWNELNEETLNVDNSENKPFPSSLQGSMVSRIFVNQEPQEQESYVPKMYMQTEEELVQQQQLVKETKEKKRRGFPKALIYLFASLIFASAILMSVAIATDVFANLVEEGKFSFPVIETKDDQKDNPAHESGSYNDLTELAASVRKSCVTVLFSGVSDISTEDIGSGVIIGEEGDMLYILTCGHVVKNATSLAVRFDGEANTNTVAYVRGYDPDTDLGIIFVYKSQINDETLKNIKIATIGDSTLLKEGQTVMAVSTPVSSTFANTVTVGVISCALREVTLVNSENVGTSYNMIQTDCAINPGSSGGGLFNAKGELVGICNATLISVDSEGIFFACPTTPNLEIITALINVGKYARPYLAITGTDALNWTYCATFNITRGVYVVSVIEDGPAYKAGLQEGDIILSFDGVEVLTMDHLKQLVLEGSVDKAVVLEILRLNENATEMVPFTLYLTLGDKTNYYE